MKETIKFETPQCNNCVFYGHNLTCFAFKKGIPDEILSGEFDHKKKHTHQSGDYTYTPVKKDND
jgi:hypothetical protein